jgi:hypothetical protein
MGTADNLSKLALSHSGNLPIEWWAGSVVVLLVSILFYRAYLHPLRKIPGPPLAKLTELWRTNRYFQGQWHQDILQLHREYGPVVRIAPNEISIVSPDLIKTAYSHNKGTVKVKLRSYLLNKHIYICL